MKPELHDHIRRTPCCPGHDKFPVETYRNRRSKKARAEGKAKEHRVVRRKSKVDLRKEMEP